MERGVTLIPVSAKDKQLTGSSGQATDCLRELPSITGSTIHSLK